MKIFRDFTLPFIFFSCMMISVIVVGLPPLILKDHSINDFNELWLVTILAYMIIRDEIKSDKTGKVRVKK